MPCPQCSSPNVWIGGVSIFTGEARPLSCNDCGWHYLNQHPCRVCGEPSEAVMSGSGMTLYGCPEHPFTDEEKQHALSMLVIAERNA